MNRIVWIIAMAAASASTDAQTVITPAGVFAGRPGSNMTVEVGDGFVKISWDAHMKTSSESVPAHPLAPAVDAAAVPAPKPTAAKVADYLILLFDETKMTPELDGLKTSETLRKGLRDAKVAWFSFGSEGFARFLPFLAARSLVPPVYLFMKGTTVLSFGVITTEEGLIKESRNLH